VSEWEPGWYPDPWGKAPRRWWDGKQWAAAVDPPAKEWDLGWYPDPWGKARWRLWDGQQWKDAVGQTVARPDTDAALDEQLQAWRAESDEAAARARESGVYVFSGGEPRFPADPAALVGRSVERVEVDNPAHPQFLAITLDGGGAVSFTAGNPLTETELRLFAGRVLSWSNGSRPLDVADALPVLEGRRVVAAETDDASRPVFLAIMTDTGEGLSIAADAVGPYAREGADLYLISGHALGSGDYEAKPS
jgi:hypothetical protein